MKGFCNSMFDIAGADWPRWCQAEHCIHTNWTHIGRVKNQRMQAERLSVCVCVPMRQRHANIHRIEQHCCGGDTSIWLAHPTTRGLALGTLGLLESQPEPSSCLHALSRSKMNTLSNTALQASCERSLLCKHCHIRGSRVKRAPRLCFYEQNRPRACWKHWGIQHGTTLAGPPGLRANRRVVGVAKALHGPPPGKHTTQMGDSKQGRDIICIYSTCICMYV